MADQQANNAVLLHGVPDDRSSVHRWRVSNVRKLNRRNKVTSQPFWVHSDESRQFQFRLVALRGAVRCEHEEEDPLGIFLEFMPKGTEKPGGSRVRCTCVNVESEAHSISAEMTTTFTEAETAVAFRNILPAARLTDPRFVTESEGGTLLVEVCIATHVNIVVQDIVRSTDQLATSIWNRAKFAFTTVATMAQQAIHTVAAQGSEHADRDECANCTPPWEVVPPSWSGRSERWRKLLTETLPQDENTFLQGPEREFSRDEQLVFTQVGLNYRNIRAAANTFNFDRDVHQGLLASVPIRTMRYHLVPRVMDDTVFWRNYLWKVRAMSQCKNEEQVGVTLSILNAPPPLERPAQQEQPKAKVMQDIAPSEQELADALRTSAEVTQLLNELLDEYQTQTPTERPSAHMIVSAYHSCQTALPKLSQIKRRAIAAPTVPDAARKEVCELEERLATVIYRFERMTIQLDSQSKAANTNTASAPANTATAPANTPPAAAASTATAVATAAQPQIGEATPSLSPPSQPLCGTGSEDPQNEAKTHASEDQQNVALPAVGFPKSLPQDADLSPTVSADHTTATANSDARAQLVVTAPTSSNPPVTNSTGTPLHGGADPVVNSSTENKQIAEKGALDDIPSIDEIPSPVLSQTKSGKEPSPPQPQPSAVTPQYAVMPWEEES